MGIIPKKSLPAEWVEASLVEMPALLAAGDALVDINVAQADARNDAVARTSSEG
jgi:hypothetical protein